MNASRNWVDLLQVSSDYTAARGQEFVPIPNRPRCPYPHPHPFPHWVSPHLRPVPTGCVPVPSPSPQNVSPSPLFLSPFPSFKISLTQWVTLSFGVQKSPARIFQQQNNVHLAHLLHTNYCMHRTAGFYCISVMLNALKIKKTNSAVLPQQISPLPRYYRELGPRLRGTTAKLVPIRALLP